MFAQLHNLFEVQIGPTGFYMLAVWQVSISSRQSQACSSRLNTEAADRATGIRLYTHT